MSVEWKINAIYIKILNTKDQKNQEINRQYKNKLKEIFQIMEGTNNVDDLWNDIKNSVNIERVIAQTNMLKDQGEKNKRLFIINQRRKKDIGVLDLNL